MKPVVVFEGTIGKDEDAKTRWREVGMVGKGTVAAIGVNGDGKDALATVTFGNEERRVVDLEGSGWAFVRGDGEGEGIEVHKEGEVIRGKRSML